MRMFSIRRIATLLIPTLLSLYFPTYSFAQDIPQTFSFTGAGYGHGVGMSQIGGKARAVAGESATTILK